MKLKYVLIRMKTHATFFEGGNHAMLLMLIFFYNINSSQNKMENAQGIKQLRGRPKKNAGIPNRAFNLTRNDHINLNASNTFKSTACPIIQYLVFFNYFLDSLVRNMKYY